jgi:hypothetical protein
MLLLYERLVVVCFLTVKSTVQNNDVRIKSRQDPCLFAKFWVIFRGDDVEAL